MDQDEQPHEPSLPQPDFDIWEFVTCAQCNVAFSSDGTSAPTVPFWITECGHVLCNAHLNADQSCPSCGLQGIELMPLQREMPPPFSDWFCSLPFKLDALAQAAKFQYERTTGAARFYKARCDHYRGMLMRLKPEIAQLQALKKENQMLKDQNARLGGGRSDEGQQYDQRNGTGYQQEPASYVNMNGKRRLVDSGLGTSSPRSIHTPIGPARITLPPSHDPPPSLARLAMPSSTGGGNNPREQPSTSRAVQPPGTSHFAQQYAYNPPQSSQAQQSMQQILSYEQQAPVRQRQQNETRLMLPPPTPLQNGQLGTAQQMQRMATPRVSAHSQPIQNTLPTPTSQVSDRGKEQRSYFQNTGGPGKIQSLGQAPRRFVPPAATGANMNGTSSNPQRFKPPTPSGSHRRFIPQTPSAGAGRRFTPSASSGSNSIQGRSFGSGSGNVQRSTFARPR